MNAVSILLPVLGVGLAGYALSTHLSPGGGGGAPDTVVVTLPQVRKTDTIVVGTATSETGVKTSVAPSDRAGLTRELQRELKRVGCYDGDISGVWTTSSRMAMKSFTDRANASLPIDQPDYILLTLVQRHQGKACGSECPGGQSLSEDGRCVPSAVLAKAGKTPVAGETKSAEKMATTSSSSWSPTAGAGADLRSPGIRGSSALVTSKAETTDTSRDGETREAQTRTASAGKSDAEETDQTTSRSKRSAKRMTRQDGPCRRSASMRSARSARCAAPSPSRRRWCANSCATCSARWPEAGEGSLRPAKFPTITRAIVDANWREKSTASKKIVRIDVDAEAQVGRRLRQVGRARRADRPARRVRAGP